VQIDRVRHSYAEETKYYGLLLATWNRKDSRRQQKEPTLAEQKKQIDLKFGP